MTNRYQREKLRKINEREQKFKEQNQKLTQEEKLESLFNICTKVLLNVSEQTPNQEEKELLEKFVDAGTRLMKIKESNI